MKITCDKSQEPKIISLGKSNRQPLTPSTLQNQSPNISSISQSSSQPQSSYFNNQNISSHPPSCIPPINVSLTPSQNLPFRIIRQYIGRPFQIRIPTTQLHYLQDQVKQLRMKCLTLQTQLDNNSNIINNSNGSMNNKSNQQKQRKELQLACMQISKSTKLIQDHLQNLTINSNNYTSRDQKFIQKSDRSDFRQDKFDRSDQYNKSEKQAEIQEYQSAVNTLQQTLNKLTQLQTKNKQLQTTLSVTKKQLQVAILENIKLRRQIQMNNH